MRSEGALQSRGLQPARSAVLISTSNIAVVQGAGLAFGLDAADDGAGVGEDGELDAVAGVEPHKELVGLNRAEAGELRAEGSQGERAGRGGVDLECSAAAEAGGGAGAAAREKIELTLAAAGAVGAGGGCVEFAEVDGAEAICCEVELGEGRQGTGCECCSIGREHADGVGGLERGGDRDRGAEDADGVAGFDLSSGTGLGEDAAETGGATRQDGELHAAGGDDAGVDERDRVLDGEVVEQVAGVEVVGAVEDDAGAMSGDERLGVLWRQVGDDGVDANR